MAFDIDGARKAGYSEAEIADHLAKSSGFDSAAARKAGYSDAEILGHLSSANAAPAPATPEPKSFGGKVMDKATAVGSGFNRSALAYIPGIAMDTVANLADLAKAGVGSAYLATGNVPPTELDPMDRTKVPGTSAWIMNKLQGSPIAPALNPTDPADEGGYLQAIGAALPGAGRGQVVQAGLAGAASKAAHDATGSPIAAVAGGFAPALARQGLAAGVKQAVRGGEDGRLAMNQRVEALQAAGVTSPTVGLATGNRFLGGVENVLQDTPGAIGIMGRSRDNALRGLEMTTQRAADLASTQRGALPAGQGIQAGIRSFADDFRNTQEQLYGRLVQEIGPSTSIPVPATRNALHGLTGATPGAEALTSNMVNPRIGGMRNAFDADTVRFSSGGEGVPRLLDPVLPFGAVKAVRSSVGEGMSNELLSGAPAAQWKQLYGGLSEDMRGGAQIAGPAAERAFGRANDYTRAGMDRVERVAPFAAKVAPEDAYQSLVGTLTGGKNTTFDAVKKTLPEGVRGQVAGTVIENLGKAPNSKQGAAGDVWSPETFLTRWNELRPEGQAKLLSGFQNADEVRRSIQAVADSTGMMRSNSMWANPSGTAGSASARDMVRRFGTAGAVALGVGGATLNPMAPVAAGVGLGTTNLLARGLTSQNNVNALRRRTEMTPETQQNLLRTLYLTGAMREDQQ